MKVSCAGEEYVGESLQLCCVEALVDRKDWTKFVFYSGGLHQAFRLPPDNKFPDDLIIQTYSPDKPITFYIGRKIIEAFNLENGQEAVHWVKHRLHELLMRRAACACS